MSPSAILNDGINVMVPGEPDIQGPYIREVVPAEGSILGNEYVEILGSFTPLNVGSVSFADRQATPGFGSAINRLWRVTPAGAAVGPVDVTANFNSPGPDSTIPNGFTYNDDPRPDSGITSLSPASGPLSGRTEVRILGNFTYVSDITFGGVSATIKVITPTYADVTTPAGVAPGPVDVVATFYDYPASTLVGAFTYNAAPLWVSMTPNTGDVAGGYEAVILGEFFGQAVVAVNMGLVVVPSFTQDGNSLTFIVPPGQVIGPVMVEVVVADGQSVKGPEPAFTYTDTP